MTDDLNPVLKAREERRQARLKAIRESTAVPRVRVIPANDAIRAHIYHPRTGMRFPAEGSAEWPLDQFTKRRIRDGDVTIEENRNHEDNRNQHGEHRRHREARAE